jgi:hypothetical protein
MEMGKRNRGDGMTHERVRDLYIVIWNVDNINIGECNYTTDDFEDAEWFYSERVKEGHQPSIFLDKTTINRTKIK